MWPGIFQFPASHFIGISTEIPV